MILPEPVVWMTPPMPKPVELIFPPLPPPAIPVMEIVPLTAVTVPLIETPFWLLRLSEPPVPVIVINPVCVLETTPPEGMLIPFAPFDEAVLALP